MDVMRRRKMPDLVMETPFSLSIWGAIKVILVFLFVFGFPILFGLFFLLGGPIVMLKFIQFRLFLPFQLLVNAIPSMLFGLIVTAFVIYGMVEFTKEIRVHLANLKKKRQWIRNAVSAQAVIVDRKEEYNSYGESIEETWLHDLALRLPSSAIENPLEQFVWARVSMGIYDKYKQGDTEQIFYSRTDPYLFLIEGE